MKVWGIIATILLIVSLIGNGWFFVKLDGLSNEVCSLASDLHRTVLTAKIGEGGVTHLSSVPEAIASIRNDANAIRLLSQKFIEVYEENESLKSENQQLRDENEALKDGIREIQDEAREAEKSNVWESLLSLIFSFF